MMLEDQQHHGCRSSADATTAKAHGVIVWVTWWGANIANAVLGTPAWWHTLYWSLRGAVHAGYARRWAVGAAPAAGVAAARGPAAVHAVRGPPHELPVPLHQLLLVLLSW